MNSKVDSSWLPETQSARSFVTKPDSTVSIVDFSMNLVKASNWVFPSSFALCCKPRVQAKIEEIGLVDSSLPFWYALQNN